MISTRLAGQDRVNPGEWAPEVPWEDRAPSPREETRAEDKNKMEGRIIAEAGANSVVRQAARALTPKIAAAVQTSIPAHRGRTIRDHAWIALLPALEQEGAKSAVVAIAAAGSASLLLLQTSGMKVRWSVDEIVPAIVPTIGQTIGRTIGQGNRLSN